MTEEELATLQIERMDMGDVIAYAIEELTTFFKNNPEDFKQAVLDERENDNDTL